MVFLLYGFLEEEWKRGNCQLLLDRFVTRVIELMDVLWRSWNGSNEVIVGVGSQIDKRHCANLPITYVNNIEAVYIFKIY